MSLRALLLPLLAASLHAEDITWQLQYDAKSLPAAPWATTGTPKATIEAEGLRLTDDDKAFANFRAAWKPIADEEIIVEVVAKVFSTTGSQKNKTSASLWPWRDGAPVSVLVSDGRHQEGLVLFANQAASHTDRFIPMDTTNRFHTYRLVIRGTDMEMWVDGEKKVAGQGAFWKPSRENVHGFKVDGFISGVFGYEIPVVVKKEWANYPSGSTGYNGLLFVLDMSNIERRPLRDRDTKLLNGREGNNEDRTLSEYLTESSWEFAQEKTHGLITGIS